MKRVVDWVSSAYEDIQNIHLTWRFLRNPFTFPSIYNTQEYSPAAVSLNDFASWIKNDIRLYSAVDDEDFLEYYPWDIFKEAYMFGSHRTLMGRPTIVSVKPNNSLMLWSIPNAAYTVVGEYYKSAQVMTTDVSVPVIPTRFQMIIVWKALMHYGAYAGADEKYAHGSNEYKSLLFKLEIAELEDMIFGEPLA